MNPDITRFLRISHPIPPAPTTRILLLRIAFCKFSLKTPSIEAAIFNTRIWRNVGSGSAPHAMFHSRNLAFKTKKKNSKIFPLKKDRIINSYPKFELATYFVLLLIF